MTRPLMPCIDGLKLIARDAHDLAVISTHLQDAICHVRDIVHLSKERRLLAQMSRFCWFSGQTEGPFKRYNAVLHFEDVLAVRARGIDQSDPDALLELLSILFSPDSDTDEEGAGPGTVILVFAGGGEIHLDVECIECALTDIAGPFEVASKPEHIAAAEEAMAVAADKTFNQGSSGL
jgi:hypothetical protein